MTLYELNNKRKKLRTKCNFDIMEIEEEFAKFNSKYKIGDIVTDGIRNIKLEKHKGVYLERTETQEIPCVIYEGSKVDDTFNKISTEEKEKVIELNILRKLN